MTHPIFAATSASLSELKKNPMGTIAAGEGFPVVILDRNEPAFYCKPPKPTRRCWSAWRTSNSTPSPTRVSGNPSIR